MTEDAKTNWQIIITTHTGDSFTLTSEVGVGKDDEITKAISDLILMVISNIDQNGIQHDLSS